MLSLRLRGNLDNVSKIRKGREYLDNSRFLLATGHPPTQPPCPRGTQTCWSWCWLTRHTPSLYAVVDAVIGLYPADWLPDLLGSSRRLSDRVGVHLYGTSRSCREEQTQCLLTHSGASISLCWLTGSIKLSPLRTIPFVIDISINSASEGQEQTKCLLAHSELPAGVCLSQKLAFCICLCHCGLSPSLFWLFEMELTQFTNCTVLRGGSIKEEDLWVLDDQFQLFVLHYSSFAIQWPLIVLVLTAFGMLFKLQNFQLQLAILEVCF